MYPIIHRDLTALESITNPVIQFFTKIYLGYSIDSILVNRFFLMTIHNFIDSKDARYRYLEQIPHTIAALIYYVSLACLSSLGIIFRLECQELCKQFCIIFIIQATLAIISLYLSIIGSLFPRLAMNITLFYGKKILEIFDGDRDETERICDFIKNFWASYRIRMQDWMLSAKRIPPDEFNYQIGVMGIHKKIETLSDINNLFQYTLQLHR